MRTALSFVFAALVFASSVADARAQAGAAPEGFTVYTVNGPGVNAPPLPFKIEGNRFLAPEGGIVSVIESEITDDRVWLSLAIPGGTANYIGLREGDRFTGFALMLADDGSDRDITPLTFTPMGGTPLDEVTYEAFASSPTISRVEVVPGNATMTPGDPRQFVARAYDANGDEISDPEVAWFGNGAGTRMDAGGQFRVIEAGEKEVVAIVEGAIGIARVEALEPELQELTIYTDVPERLAAGSRVPLEIDALNSFHRWELEPNVEIASSDEAVVSIDGHTLVAVSPGRATVTIGADEATEAYTIEVVAAGAGPLAITGLPSGAVRTGDVVELAVDQTDARPVWSVVERGADVFADGAFVAERPGRYTVVAILGERTATATIEAESRGMAGRIHIAGHGLNPETFSSDLWPQNSFVYVGTHMANELRTYDVSDPANPVLTDRQEFDARVVNDVKVSEDGRWLVATREGAADRHNGILIFSLENPGQPELIAEYTETLTAGVHNVFWVGDLVYAVNDGTGDMHIIDLSDPVNPREVGRWGLPNDGRSLHDVWVQDGVAYLSYLNDGLVILDVGGADQGGTPDQPVQVSRIFYEGGPTHAAMRYGDYVFVGDEDFSLQGTVPSVAGNDPRGPVHIIDVSDLASPKYVARYEVPEAGAHNMWIEDGVMYIGYYQGGIRAVDVSGELRGDLYEQGREIAYFLPTAGPDEAARPYQPRTWGVFPMFTDGWGTVGDMLFATDYNSGLWSFTVEMPERPIS